MAEDVSEALRLMDVVFLRDMISDIFQGPPFLNIQNFNQILEWCESALAT